jgi:hypothetical protein
LPEREEGAGVGRVQGLRARTTFVEDPDHSGAVGVPEGGETGQSGLARSRIDVIPSPEDAEGLFAIHRTSSHTGLTYTHVVTDHIELMPPEIHRQAA